MAAFLRLHELFLESGGFSKDASFFVPAGTEVSDGQGLTPPLHPRKGFHPLTRFAIGIQDFIAAGLAWMLGGSGAERPRPHGAGCEAA